MVKVSVPNIDINFMTAKADDKMLISLFFIIIIYLTRILLEK